MLPFPYLHHALLMNPYAQHVYCCLDYSLCHSVAVDPLWVEVCLCVDHHRPAQQRRVVPLLVLLLVEVPLAIRVIEGSVE